MNFQVDTWSPTKNYSRQTFWLGFFCRFWSTLASFGRFSSIMAANSHQDKHFAVTLFGYQNDFRQDVCFQEIFNLYLVFIRLEKARDLNQTNFEVRALKSPSF